MARGINVGVVPVLDMVPLDDGKALKALEDAPMKALTHKLLEEAGEASVAGNDFAKRWGSAPFLDAHEQGDLADELADTIVMAVTIAAACEIDLPAAIGRCEKRCRERERIFGEVVTDDHPNAKDGTDGDAPTDVTMPLRVILAGMYEEPLTKERFEAMRSALDEIDRKVLKIRQRRNSQRKANTQLRRKLSQKDDLADDLREEILRLRKGLKGERERVVLAERQAAIYKGMHEREQKCNEELNLRVGMLSEVLRRAGVDVRVCRDGRLVAYWGDDGR